MNFENSQFNNPEEQDRLRKEGVDPEASKFLTSIAEEVEPKNTLSKQEREAKTAEIVNKITKVLSELGLTPSEAMEKTQFVADRAMISEEDARKILMALSAEEKTRPVADVIDMTMPTKKDDEMQEGQDGGERVA